MASTHVALVTADGTSNRRIASSLYGYCTTAAGTAAKTVSLYTGNSTTADGTWAAADLFHGLTITVRFQYSNTASSPTLNVNGTGAKSIYKYGTTAPGTTASTSWQAQGVVSFTYDTLLNASGCWVMNDHLDDTTGGGGSYTEVTGKPTSNLTPDFGDTITISQISQSTTGQVSATDRTIKIPELPSTEWTLQGSALGTNTVTIPSTAKEVMVLIKPYSTTAFSGTAVIDSNFTNVTVWHVGGYYYSSSDNGLTNINVSNSGRTYQLRYVRYNGTDRKSSTYLYVYYK